MSVQKQAVRNVSSQGSRLGVSFKGGEYEYIPGASSVDYTAGTRSKEDVHTFRGTSSSLGAKTVEPMTFELSAPSYQVAGMAKLEQAEQTQELVSVRYDIYGQDIARIGSQATDPKVAVAVPAALAKRKGGALTFSVDEASIKAMFNSDEILPGDFLFPTAITADNLLIINWIDVDEANNNDFEKAYVVKTGGREATVVAAAFFAVRSPGARWQFQARVAQIGSMSANASGAPSMSSSIQFQPVNDVGFPTPLLVDEDGADW